MPGRKNRRRATAALVAVKMETSTEDDLPVASVAENDYAETINIREVVSIPPSSASPGLPSLPPVRIPYPAQHDLLLKVQDILERACFDYARRELPDLLKSRGWTSYQCAEFTRWTRILPHHLGNKQVPAPYENIFSFFASVREMRNTVVHRHHRYATKTMRYLEDSKTLALMLGDRQCWETLDRLALETQDLVTKLTENVASLERKHHDFVQEINEQREQLHRLECASWEKAKEENLDYQRRLGESYSETINNMDCASKRCPLHHEQSQEVIPHQKKASFNILRLIWNFLTRQVDDEVAQPESSES
ncbi:hypothetical protein CkaCkLH20_00806 [Colletotrichum karsti]|uniref:Ubiquinol-cytochrome-c reductase cytochrome c1 n=1 Tax=Colletotrichum karsti TaxID=1095194 RepID=A0A9P6IFA5_9PEZI|nr:uncharacterized protein CkaCkLH20_00806 [Colletotrichum karsti]KAF9881660.1 hypothetical protein CkaCkLH20_00806 [Colletotrichum karsti]